MCSSYILCDRWIDCAQRSIGVRIWQVYTRQPASLTALGRVYYRSIFLFHNQGAGNILRDWFWDD